MVKLQILEEKGPVSNRGPVGKKFSPGHPCIDLLRLRVHSFGTILAIPIPV